MKKDLNTLWEEIIYWNIATQEELELITSINGFNIETLNDVIYARTGYRNLEQYKEYEIEE
jgi:hypothetical protein